MILLPPLAALYLIQGSISGIYRARSKTDAQIAVLLKQHVFIICVELIFISVQFFFHYIFTKVLFDSQNTSLIGTMLSIGISALCNYGLGYSMYILVKKRPYWLSRSALTYVFVQSCACYLFWNVFIFFLPLVIADLFIIGYYSVIFAATLLLLTTLRSQLQIKGQPIRLAEQYLSRFIHVALIALGVYVIEYFLLWHPIFLPLVSN